MLGLLLGQVLGNALVEEVAWRGFALPQLFWRLAARWRGHAGRALVATLLASQAVFAVMHIPNRLYQHLTVAELPLGLVAPLALGLVFALVYLRTGNLFVATGLHALYDAPTTLFARGDVPALLALAVVAVALLLWPRPASPARRPAP